MLGVPRTWHSKDIRYQKPTSPSVKGKGMTVLELCAGAGGQAIGLEQAGFSPSAVVERDPNCCDTLRKNRPKWNVVNADIRSVSVGQLGNPDLIAAGLPCPPFSIAGKQLGSQDDRNLFPAALDIVTSLRPKALMIENVRGLKGVRFNEFRSEFERSLTKLGYVADWKLLNASDFGVPQLRPRFVLVAMRRRYWSDFDWPDQGDFVKPPTVGEALNNFMRRRGWKFASAWARAADRIAPTIVGGSHKHGGADLGPTRAKQAWKELGVDGLGIADEAPLEEFVGIPKLTNLMVARLQGFDESWKFCGGKTAIYRQIGNAFPPPVSRAIGLRIYRALTASKS